MAESRSCATNHPDGARIRTIHLPAPFGDAEFRNSVILFAFHFGSSFASLAERNHPRLASTRPYARPSAPPLSSPLRSISLSAAVRSACSTSPGVTPTPSPRRYAGRHQRLSVILTSNPVSIYPTGWQWSLKFQLKMHGQRVICWTAIADALLHHYFTSNVSHHRFQQQQQIIDCHLAGSVCVCVLLDVETSFFFHFDCVPCELLFVVRWMASHRVGGWSSEEIRG